MAAGVKRFQGVCKISNLEIFFFSSSLPGKCVGHRNVSHTIHTMTKNMQIVPSQLSLAFLPSGSILLECSCTYATNIPSRWNSRKEITLTWFWRRIPAIYRLFPFTVVSNYRTAGLPRSQDTQYQVPRDTKQIEYRTAATTVPKYHVRYTVGFHGEKTHSFVVAQRPLPRGSVLVRTRCLSCTLSLARAQSMEIPCSIQLVQRGDRKSLVYVNGTEVTCWTAESQRSLQDEKLSAREGVNTADRDGYGEGAGVKDGTLIRLVGEMAVPRPAYLQVWSNKALCDM